MNWRHSSFPDGPMGRLRLALPPVVVFFCCGAGCGPRSQCPGVGRRFPRGSLAWPAVVCTPRQGGARTATCSAPPALHHFGVLQVRPHIRILAAFVEHLPDNSATGSNPHGWGHLVHFWFGVELQRPPSPSATSSSANRDDDTKSTIWWHQLAGR